MLSAPSFLFCGQAEAWIDTTLELVSQSRLVRIPLPFSRSKADVLRTHFSSPISSLETRKKSRSSAAAGLLCPAGSAMAVSKALVSFLLLASCALAAAAPATVISQKTYYQLIKRVFFGNTTSGPCSVNGSNYLDIDLGPGSGAFVIGKCQPFFKVSRRCWMCSEWRLKTRECKRADCKILNVKPVTFMKAGVCGPLFLFGASIRNWEVLRISILLF